MTSPSESPPTHPQSPNELSRLRLALVTAERNAQKWHQQYKDLAQRYNDLGTKAERYLNLKIDEYETALYNLKLKHESQLKSLDQHYAQILENERLCTEQVGEAFVQKEAELKAQISCLESRLETCEGHNSNINELKQENARLLEVNQKLEKSNQSILIDFEMERDQWRARTTSLTNEVNSLKLKLDNFNNNSGINSINTKETLVLLNSKEVKLKKSSAEAQKLKNLTSWLSMKLKFSNIQKKKSRRSGKRKRSKIRSKMMRIFEKKSQNLFNFILNYLAKSNLNQTVYNRLDRLSRKLSRDVDQKLDELTSRVEVIKGSVTLVNCRYRELFSEYLALFKIIDALLENLPENLSILLNQLVINEDNNNEVLLKKFLNELKLVSNSGNAFMKYLPIISDEVTALEQSVSCISDCQNQSVYQIDNQQPKQFESSLARLEDEILDLKTKLESKNLLIHDFLGDQGQFCDQSHRNPLEEGQKSNEYFKILHDFDLLTDEMEQLRLDNQNLIEKVEFLTISSANAEILDENLAQLENKYSLMSGSLLGLEQLIMSNFDRSVDDTPEEITVNDGPSISDLLHEISVLEDNHSALLHQFDYLENNFELIKFENSLLVSQIQDFNFGISLLENHCMSLHDNDTCHQAQIFNVFDLLCSFMSFGKPVDLTRLSQEVSKFQGLSAEYDSLIQEVQKQSNDVQSDKVLVSDAINQIRSEISRHETSLMTCNDEYSVLVESLASVKEYFVEKQNLLENLEKSLLEGQNNVEDDVMLYSSNESIVENLKSSLENDEKVNKRSFFECQLVKILVDNFLDIAAQTNQFANLNYDLSSLSREMMLLKEQLD
ncbi:hypothetical protein P9112_000438 [Eukaryota sp. TZLM1-RC]